jgi:formate-nitrite transporter family protein
MSTHKQGVLTPDVHDKDHRIGSPDAPVTLVEYGDFQCPYCFRAHPIVTAIRNRLGERLRFVFRNFPLKELHPNALHAAEAAESVAANSGEETYWAMHDSIYEHQQDSADALDDAHLGQYAASVGADSEQTQRDLDSGAFEARVRVDFMSGVRSGVNGTPTFFINGARFEGDWTDIREFTTALEVAEATAAA